jgi:hypothetical protein
MAWPLRIEFPGAFYQVMNRGNKGIYKRAGPDFFPSHMNMHRLVAIKTIKEESKWT